MPINGSQKDCAILRRERVAALRLQGYTIREICELLREEGIFNHESGEAFSHQQIFNDLKKIKAEWINNARESYEAHIGKILAELELVKRKAWKEKNGESADIKNIMRALELEYTAVGGIKLSEIEEGMKRCNEKVIKVSNGNDSST